MKSQHYTTVAQNHIYRHNKNSNVKYWFFGLIIFNSILLFMPWTQNIRSSGNITTIRQEQRPQELNSIIPGKVVKWFVKEGDLVNQGDTILQLSEIKDEYLDPNLINRTGEQLSAKQMSVDYYKGKAGTASSQIDALINERELKLEQTRNKLKQQERRIQSDELEFVAAQNEFAVATRQITAGQAMLDSGVISMIDFEKRKVNFQNIQRQFAS